MQTPPPASLYDALVADAVTRIVRELRPLLREDVAALIAEMHGPLCLGVAKTATLLDVSETTVRQLAYQRRLPVQVGIPSDRLLIDYPALRRHLAGHVESRAGAWEETVAQITAARGR